MEVWRDQENVPVNRVTGNVRTPKAQRNAIGNLHERKRTFEREVKQSDDRVAAWERYIAWIEALPESQLSIINIDKFDLLQSCIEEMIQEGKSNDDPRLLKIAFKFIDSAENPTEMFDVIKSFDIGTHNVLLYSTWGHVLESEEDYDLAIKVYEDGISNMTTSVEKQKLKSMKERVEMKIRPRANKRPAADQAQSRKPNKIIQHLPALRNYAKERGLSSQMTDAGYIVYNPALIYGDEEKCFEELRGARWRQERERREMLRIQQQRIAEEDKIQEEIMKQQHQQQINAQRAKEKMIRQQQQEQRMEQERQQQRERLVQEEQEREYQERLKQERRRDEELKQQLLEQEQEKQRQQEQERLLQQRRQQQEEQERLLLEQQQRQQQQEQERLLLEQQKQQDFLASQVKEMNMESETKTEFTCPSPTINTKAAMQDVMMMFGPPATTSTIQQPPAINAPSFEVFDENACDENRGPLQAAPVKAARVALKPIALSSFTPFSDDAENDENSLQPFQDPEGEDEMMLDDHPPCAGAYGGISSALSPILERSHETSSCSSRSNGSTTFAGVNISQTMTWDYLGSGISKPDPQPSPLQPTSDADSVEQVSDTRPVEQVQPITHCQPQPIQPSSTLPLNMSAAFPILEGIDTASLPGCVSMTSLDTPTLRAGSTIQFGANAHCEITTELESIPGSGITIFEGVVTEATRESVKLCKVSASQEAGLCLDWEHYMLTSLQSSLQDPNAKRSLDLEPKLFHFNGGNILVVQHGSDGSLANAIDALSMDEYLVMYYAYELLSAIKGLHSCDIIHGNISPSTVLTRRDGPVPDGPWNPTGKCGWSEIGVKLCGFEHACTSGAPVSNPTKPFELMKETGRTDWNHQVDYFGLAGVVHALLHKAPLKVQNKDDVWMPATPFRRYWKNEVWENLFSDLLNETTIDFDEHISRIRATITKNSYKAKAIPGLLTKQDEKVEAARGK